MQSVSTPMIGWSVDIRKDPCVSKENDKELLGAEIPYLSEMCVILYSAQYTQPDITF